MYIYVYIYICIIYMYIYICIYKSIVPGFPVFRASTFDVESKGEPSALDDGWYTDREH